MQGLLFAGSMAILEGRAFDTTRLEVDALRAMLSLPPQAESRERREDDPERPPP